MKKGMPQGLPDPKIHWGTDDEAFEWYITNFNKILDSHDKLEHKLKDSEKTIAEQNQILEMIPSTDIKKYIGELERKLKIAEDCFDKAIRSLKNGSHTKNIAVIIINEALKQIRGE